METLSLQNKGSSHYAYIKIYAKQKRDKVKAKSDFHMNCLHSHCSKEILKNHWKVWLEINGEKGVALYSF